MSPNRFLAVGKPAPVFSLPNQAGKKVSLKDFKGKKHVVLYFYPKALTSGCTVQACAIRDHANQFKKLNLEVLGVSIDSVERLKKFAEKEGLNFNLLSDEDHQIAEKYGVWQKKKLYGREYMGLVRSTYIIGKDGKIKHIMPKVATKTHHCDVLEWATQNLVPAKSKN